MMIQTKEKDFSRDTNSRALINTNIKAREEHLAKRKALKEVAELKQDVAELKELVKQLIDRQNT